MKMSVIHLTYTTSSLSLAYLGNAQNTYPSLQLAKIISHGAHFIITGWKSHVSY